MQSFVHKLVHQEQTYMFYDLESILGQEALNALPFSLRLLVENMVRKAPHALSSFLEYPCILPEPFSLTKGRKLITSAPASGFTFYQATKLHQNH